MRVSVHNISLLLAIVVLHTLVPGSHFPRACLTHCTGHLVPSCSFYDVQAASHKYKSPGPYRMFCTNGVYPVSDYGGCAQVWHMDNNKRLVFGVHVTLMSVPA